MCGGYEFEETPEPKIDVEATIKALEEQSSGPPRRFARIRESLRRRFRRWRLKMGLKGMARVSDIKTHRVSAPRN